MKLFAPAAFKAFLRLFCVLVLIAVIFVPFKPSPVHAAANYYVNDGATAGDVFCSAVGDNANDGQSGATPKRNIQALIDAYVLGVDDTVYVDAGTYTENATVTAADNSLTLQGAGMNLTIIDGTGFGCCLTLTGLSDGKVDGFTFSHGNAGGINISSFGVEITACRIHGNSAPAFGGIYMNGTANTVKNCILDQNACTDYGGGGISINGFSNLVSSSTFFSNFPNTGISSRVGPGSNTSGVWFEDAGGAGTRDNIVNCILWDSTGLEITYDAGDPYVLYSDVMPSYIGGATVFSADPLFADAAAGDFHLKSKEGRWTPGGWVQDAQHSPCIDAGSPGPWTNEPAYNGGRANIGAYANTAQASKSLTPHLVLTQGVSAIANGGTYDYGSRASGSHTDITFTITNNGTGAMTLATPLAIAGPDIAQFVLLTQPVSPVAVLGATTFSVRFYALDTTALKTASISFSNNDTAMTPYNLTLTGSGTVPSGGSSGGAIVNSGPTYTQTNINILGTSKSVRMDDEGHFSDEVTASGAGGAISLRFPAGTLVKEANGSNLAHDITMTPVQNAPAPPANADIIGLPYNFKPEGVTFIPAITLTFTYDPADLPPGADESNLKLAYYNESTGQWVTLTGIVDPLTHTISARISHFSTYAIISSVDKAAFSVSGLSLAPATAAPGETVTAAVALANTGNIAGEYHLDLKINGTVESTRDVSVAPGENRMVSFTLAPEKAGTYEVDINGLTGSFSVTTPVPPPVITTPAPVTVTSTVTATVTVTVPAPAETTPTTTSTPEPETNASANWWLVGGGILAGVLLVVIIARMFLGHD